MKNKFLILTTVFAIFFLFETDCFADSVNRENVFKGLSEQIDFIKKNYYLEISEEELIKGMTEGLYNSLDKWSGVFNSEEMKKFIGKLNDEFIGIGISVEKIEDYVLIKQVFEDSPAKKAGLSENDKIFFIDGASIAKLNIEKIISLLHGDEGTSVELKYKKNDSSVLNTLNIKREKFIIKSATHREEKDVDIITISSFDEQTYQQFMDIIKKEKFQNGLIIDLRNNPGGYLETATDIADELLQKGRKIISIHYRNSKDEVILSKRVGITDKIVVLINENSASASELLASSLQDNYRARIIGENSFGKGVVQEFFDIGNGRFVKLTTGEYLSPLNRKIQGIGVAPEIRIAKEHEILKLSYEFKPMISDTVFTEGDENIEIYGIKQRLNYLGADLELSSVFDRKTVEEVNKIKKKFGKYKDGVIDSKFKEDLSILVDEKADEIVEKKQLERAIKELKN